MSKCAYCLEGIHQGCIFYIGGYECDCMDNDHKEEEDA